MDILSNRELAFFIWGCLVAIYCLVSADIRSSFLKIIAMLFQWRIILYIGVSVAYFAAILLGVNTYFPLDASLLKDACLWFVFSGLISTGRSIRSKGNDLLQDHFFDSFKFTVLFEFILASYVFPLWVELVLIPCATFIAVAEAYAKTKEKYEKARKIFSFLLQVIGIGILGMSVYSATLDYRNLVGLASIKGFLLPFLLLVFYFPLTYLWVLKSRYEQLFVPIKVIFRNIKKTKVGAYLRRRLFFHCWFSTKKLQGIIEHKFGFWQSIESKDDAKKFMTCVRTGGYFGERYE